MIIPNGVIRFAELVSGGGIDPKTHNAIPPVVDYSAEKPCQVIPLSVDNLGTTKEGGRFVRARYEVLLELADDVSTSERVRVQTDDGLLVGDELSVIARIPLEAVGQSRLLV